MSDTVEQIKERLDLAQLVGEYVVLKPAGQNLKGLCPFHSEKSPSFIVSPGRGSWHCFGCFPPGQKVKTPFGYHSIENLDENHFVVSGKGKIRKILMRHDRLYDGELVNIRLRKLSYPVQLTTDHNVLVVRGSASKSDYKVFSRQYKPYLKVWAQDKVKYQKKVDRYFPVSKIPAGEIQEGDLLMYPIDETVEPVASINLEDYLTHTTRLGPKPKKIPWNIPISDAFLTLCGYYVAEGSNHRAYVRFSLGSHEKQFAQDIVYLVREVFDLEAVVHERKGEKTGLEVTVCQAQLANIFENLMGKGAANKHIPFIFQRLPVAQQKVLLNAIHRGDGTTFTNSKSEKRSRSVTSISRTLAEQSADILLRSGFFPTVTLKAPRTDKLGVNHREAFTVSWSEEVDSRYNVIYYYEGSKYWLLPISSLGRSAYRGPVYNLMVEDDHSYVASSFAVANCGEGGDGFTFIQKIEGLDFPGALKLLAERTGVEIVRSNEPSRNYRQRLFDCLTEATRFYQHVLLKNKAGDKAREYLLTRGVTLETLAMFEVGYAPMTWNTVSTWLTKKGFTLEEMQAVGLVVKNERGKTYDRFRGRIMFPVYDTQGRVVAFGGRIVPWHETGNEGKYVNSPETALYEKRRVVYNLQRAKQWLRGGAPVIVVEGYMDVVMLVQNGVQNVVASSGTAFTAEHIQQLARFTKTLHFAFDGDGAGWKATIGATSAALASGMNVATVVLPDGKDPADVALESGPEVSKYFEHPVSLVSLLLQQLQREGDAAGKEQQLQAMLPLLKMIPNPIVQGKMVQEVAAALHVTEQQVHKLLMASAGLALPNALAEEAPSRQNRQALPEWDLLGFLLMYPAIRQEWLPKLTGDFFTDSRAGTLFMTLTALAEQEAGFLEMEMQDVVQRLPAEMQSFAQGLVALAEEFLTLGGEEVAKEADLLYSRLQRRALMSRLNILQETLSSATSDERAEVLRQFQTVTQELSAISHF